MYLAAFWTLEVAFAFTREFTASVFAFVVAIAVVAGTIFPIETNVACASTAKCSTFAWVVVVLSKHSHDFLLVNSYFFTNRKEGLRYRYILPRQRLQTKYFLEMLQLRIRLLLIQQCIL